VRRLAQQLASALDAVAAAGLVHLDVKPENVLFASDDTEHAYVRDFGAGRLAAWKAGLGQGGAFGGTLEYAAPEQIEGDAADGRTLVYSLGCLLYEALTGATPYAGRSSTELVPPPVGGGADVRRVFAIALAQRRDERYATCTDFADALDAALAALPVPRPARGTRRRRVVSLRGATVAAFVAFVAAAAATAASWLAQGAPGASDAAQDKPYSNSAFIASLPKADPAVKAVRKQIRAVPSVTRVSARKAARPKPHRVAPKSLASVDTPTATSGTAPIASPSPTPASAPAAPRRSSAPETTTTAAATGLPLPPPPPSTAPPQDSAPPLPPPPP
jgi:serine/threonine protein kinase